MSQGYPLPTAAANLGLLEGKILSRILSDGVSISLVIHTPKRIEATK
jgi:hypothetical protein